MNESLRGLLPGSNELQVLAITGYVALVMCVAVTVLHKEAKEFMRPSKWMLLYVLPLACVALLQFKYQGPLPVWLFIVMIVVSVTWQDVLTFGFFQGRVRRLTSMLNTILVVGFLFGFGHVVALTSDMSQIASPGFYLLLVVGILFAWLREKTSNIYVINVLHMTFLLVTMVSL